MFEYLLLRTMSGRLFIERAWAIEWPMTGKTGVGVDARPVHESDVLVNGKPRPGWWTTGVDWAHGKAGRGYKNASRYVLAQVILEEDGSITERDLNEYDAWLDERVAEAASQ